jgi:hypothetical protein
MKYPFALRTQFLVLLIAGWSITRCIHAQESIPLNEAQRIAQKLASTPTDSSDQPFTIDVNADRPVGLKGGEAGLIVLPDKHLTADSLANAGKSITPVAQLWTYLVTLASNGKRLETGKVRMVTVNDGDKNRDVQLYLIGVTKTEQGGVELVIFGKGSEPVLHVPLTKGSASAQDFPIVASGHQTGDDSATLTLNLPGQFTADIGVVKAAD